MKRRKWIVVGTTIVVTLVSVTMAMRQTPLYDSSATVLLKYENLASGLTGIQDLSNVYQDPARISETQTQIAMSPAVARRVARSGVAPALTADEVLGMTSVTASPDSDVLVFTVTGSDPALTETLATAHAKAYIAHRQALDNASLVAARKELQGRIDELQQSEFKNSELLANLIENEQQLRTMEALQTANASLLRPAEGAIQVQPKVVRSAVLGVILGLMLGVALAFARDALDTRVRTAAEIGEALELPMLGRIATPPKKLRQSNTLVMLAKPHGTHAEAFRVLRSNLEFVNIDRGARSIMITSALEAEGKSTTASNLAVALAHAGRKVALVDLDLRRPSLATFFDLPPAQPGLTDVVLGKARLDMALVDVIGSLGSDPVVPYPATGALSAEGNGAGALSGALDTARGLLSVLPSGPTPPNPGEFVSSRRVEHILHSLSEIFDIVIIDTPPLLSVGDAIALSPRVDAMVCVARLNVIRRPSLHELQRALATCPTIKLGYVATGADNEDGYGYGAYEYYGRGFDYDVAVPSSIPSTPAAP